MLRIGDFVTRISYNHDMYFKVTSITNGIAQLKAYNYRLHADAPVEDLVIVHNTEVDDKKENEVIKALYSDYVNQSDSHNFFIKPGVILHLDGDKDYLTRSIKMYKRLNVPAYGLHIKESEQFENILYYIGMYHPDIVVVTGHDNYSEKLGEKANLAAYKNSLNFIKVIQKIRTLYPSYDDLIIVAGACKSHFEALLKAGANFASSPKRVNIHAVDPVIVASIISYTSYSKNLDIKKIVTGTISGKEGMGGIQTKGKLRLGYPS